MIYIAAAGGARIALSAHAQEFEQLRSCLLTVMATERAVLLQFGERKKVIKIRSREGVEDRATLKEEFFKAFFTGTHCPDEDVLLQQYDQSWDDYIDLDEDYKVSDKDRLRAIIPTSTSGGIPVSGQDCQVVSYNILAMCDMFSMLNWGR